VEALSPVSSWIGGLEQQGANDRWWYESCAQPCCSGEGVWKRHPELDAVREEENVEGVIKLASIISLHTLDGATKLHGHIAEEVRASGEDV
jgi:hypothetical protein